MNQSTDRDAILKLREEWNDANYPYDLCPGCGVAVQLIGGCDDVICAICGADFRFQGRLPSPDFQAVLKVTWSMFVMFIWLTLLALNLRNWGAPTWTAAYVVSFCLMILRFLVSWVCK